ncbi:MAG: hypothetical protein NZM42_12600 [Gemmatales bacterium]|nr:hypothetical protein [Gemmatales bacterium]MDW8222355.1 hypothetical protein [Gemmatales bacterium]
MTNIYEELEQLVAKAGAGAAVDRLIRELEERRDYTGYFYALVLAKRLELGLPAVQSRFDSQVPAELAEPYEQGIREAARRAGRLALAAQDVGAAWPFFRMIQEPKEVAQVLEKLEPQEPEQCQQLVQIALYEGAHPRRGFQWVLQHYGICNAITTFAQGFPGTQEDRIECLKLLVRALYDELKARLISDMAQREGVVPPAASSVSELLRGREQSLFADDFAHVDTSHLSSVVQFAYYLPVCEELRLAVELCEYGRHLNSRLQYPGDPPFEQTYHDYLIYFRTLLGAEVEAGLEHFRQKAEQADPAQVGYYPAVVYVGLLERLGRHREAVEAYSRYLAHCDPQQLGNCPSIYELCDRLGDYRPLVDIAQRRGSLVDYTAGLIQQMKAKPCRATGANPVD